MQRGLIAAALSFALLLPAGCAYFNLFYNAEKAFSEAENLGKNIDPRNQPTGNQKSKYRTCINKCELLLEEYPDSDYIDDALFLMGKSYFRLKEARNYRAAIQNFDLVLSNFPGSEFAPEALYLKSLAHLALGDEEIARDNLARLQEAEGGNRFAIEALFRLGDAYLEREDYETAIGYYEDYLENHPKAPDATAVALHKAGAEFELQRYESVIATLESFDRGPATRRESFELDLLLARSLHRLGRSEEAAVVLDRISDDAEAFGQRESILVLQGEIELGRGNEEEGLSLLRDLANEFQRKPTESAARFTIASYYFERFGPGDERLFEELTTADESRAGGPAMTDVRRLLTRVKNYRALRDSMQSTSSDSVRAVSALELGELLLTELDRPREALENYLIALGAEDLLGDSAARAAFAMAFIYERHLDRPDSAELARSYLRERFPASVQARSLDGELFVEARPRTEAEIAAILAGDFSGGDSSRGGSGDFGGSGSRSGRRRSLARGGPGATGPREAIPR